MRKTIKALLVSLVLLVFSVGVVSAATRVTMDPGSLTVLTGEEFEVNLVIDSRGDEVFGTSTTVLYPWSDVDLIEVSGGDFFANFEYGHDSSIGRLELHGFFDKAADSKVGSGRLVKLKFNTKASSGSGRVSVICRDNDFTRVVNSNGEDVADCLQMGHIDLYYSYAETATPTPVPTPSPTPEVIVVGTPASEVIEYKGGGAQETVEPEPTLTELTTPEPAAFGETEPVDESALVSMGGYQLDQVLMLVAIGAGGLGLILVLIYLVGRAVKKTQTPTNSGGAAGV